MVIHYQTADGTEKFIKNVLHLQNIDNEVWAALLSNGKELTLLTERIEAVVEDEFFDPMGKHEVSGHCASCRFWMTTLSPEDRAEAARYENTDGVCDMFNEDGFSPNDYCSRWEAREEVADKENQIENC